LPLPPPAGWNGGGGNTNWLAITGGLGLAGVGIAMLPGGPLADLLAGLGLGSVGTAGAAEGGGAAIAAGGAADSAIAGEAAGGEIAEATAIAEVAPSGNTEIHHLLPQAFKEQFEQAGLNIEQEEYLVPVERNFHQNVIHGFPDANGIWKNSGDGGQWNLYWQTFFGMKDVTGLPYDKTEILDLLTQMRSEFGI
jgi:hypothetical protein